MGMHFTGRENTPAEDCFDFITQLMKDRVDVLSEEELKGLASAKSMINALDVLNYQCLNSCKRMGFKYNPEIKGGEFTQAFFWLQEKGFEAHRAATADDAYELLIGVEKHVNELFKLFQEKKNGS